MALLTGESRSMVGVVAEVRRTEGNYHCPRCTVFGIDEEEHALFRRHGVKIYPREFVPEADKYQLDTNAWKAMRILGLFGYRLPCAPIGGKTEDGPTGERRTSFYTLESTVRWKKASNGKLLTVGDA